MPTPRSIRTDEISGRTELLDDVFRRSKGVEDQSQLTDFPLVYCPANDCNSFVIVTDGQVVSHAAIWPRELIVESERFKIGVIVSVATHPDFRRRGFAAALMRELQQLMRQQNYDLGILWTGVPDFYRRLGWKIVHPRGSLVHLNEAQNAPVLPADCRATAFEPERHLDEVESLSRQHPVRLVRSRDDNRTLLTLPKIQTWVLERRSSVVSYLVHAGAINKRGLIEYGGELDGITALIHHVAGRSQPMPLLAYHTRADLLQWARNSGLPMEPHVSSKGFGDEMVYVLNAARISQPVLDRLFVWGLDWA